MKRLKKIFIFLFTLFIFALLILFINEKVNEKVFLREYTFAHEEIPQGFDGYEIMVISDLHEAPFSEMIIEHINTHKPDIVVFTGDMVQLPDHSLNETVKIGKAIKDIPMYAVSGNHETQGGAYDEIISTLWSVDIIPLDNDSVCLEKDGDTILLLGIKDPKADIVPEEKFKKIRKQIESEFPDGPCFSVLLSHRADIYPQIKDTSADLILSGHMHGGIIRLPFIGGIIGKNTENSLLPEYEYGVIKEGNSATMIVSGGCDKNPQKKRYLNPPEVVLVNLKSE